MRTRAIIALLAATAPGIARADAKSDLFDDAKSVIEDLITKEISETTVEEIACRAGHVQLPAPDSTHPGGTDPNQPWVVTIQVGAAPAEYYGLQALAYFPATMRRLYAGQFAGLQSTVVAEAADYAGYLVYQLLTSPTSAADSKLDLQTATFDELRKTSKGASSLRDETALLHLATHATALDTTVYGALPEPRHGLCKAEVLKKMAAGLNTMPSKLDEVCAAEGADPFACEIANAVRAAVLGDGKSVQQHVLQAFANFVDAKDVAKIVSILTDQTVALGDVKTLFANLKITLDPAYEPIVERLRMIVRSSTHFDMAQVRGLVSLAETICKTNPPAPCKGLLSLSKAMKAQAMLPLLEAALRGDIHETVHLVIDTILQHNRSNSECDTVHRCTKSLYETFFESLAYYVIDIANTGGATVDTRAAFRSAAEDVIRYQWPGGYQRGGYYGFRLRPDFALRASWNQGNISTTGSSYRSVAAIPWLMWRYPVWYTNVVYVGAQGSLLDVIAPLAELSLRPNSVNNLPTHFDNESRVWADFVAPRVAVELGLPALSTHLVVDLGVAVRLEVPYANGTSVDSLGNTTANYRYLAPWDSNGTLTHSLDLALSLKYVP